MRRGTWTCGWLLVLGVALSGVGCGLFRNRRCPCDDVQLPPRAAPGPVGRPGATGFPDASRLQNPPALPKIEPPKPPAEALTTPDAGVTPAAAVSPPAANPQAQQPPPDPLAPLRKIHVTAAKRYEEMDGFVCQLTRREQVNGKDQPEEEIQFQFRARPFSVHFQWVGKVAQGREVVFVQGQYDGLIHTRMGKGDLGALFIRRTNLPPDDPKVRAFSRHSITEAGFGHLLQQFGQILDAQAHGDTRLGTATYLGPQTCPESATPLEGVEQVIPPGTEAALPEGGRRVVLFSPETGLPVVVTTKDPHGHEVEYYRYDNLQPAKFGDDDFNPDRVLGRK
jgi:Protein of unknown function (DUF1571)